MTLFSFIKSKISVLDIILEYVQLKQAGHYWKGRCPFHMEKDASFTVSPEKQIFYCFGCQAGGDVIAFIAKVENISQVESVWHLVDRYKIEVPKELKHEIQDFQEQKSFYDLCSAVADWCHKELFLNDRAKKYIAARDINLETVKYFKIGFFPGGSLNRFIKDMVGKNILSKDLLDSGVLIQAGKILYSPFEERIIFPISDVIGRACGFGGRIYKENDERARYYNSKESPFFQKGQLLFGLDLAKKEMREKETTFLVEGYTDCVAMVQHGYKNVVATLGTACTEEHLKLLSRYVNTLFVIYDGDAAGQKAILRLVELCWDVNLDLKIIKLLETEDPASFLENGGDLENLVSKAVDIFSFFVDSYGKQFFKKALSEKLKLSNKIIEILGRINDPFKQNLLLQRAANVMQIPYESLKDLLSNSKIPIDDGVPVLAEEQEEGVLEKRILFAIINNMDHFEKFPLDEDIEAYFSEASRLFLAKVKDVIDNEELSNRFGVFFERLDEKQQQWVSLNCLKFGGEITPTQFRDIIIQFQKFKWRDVIADLKFKIVNAQKLKNQEELQALTKEFIELKKEMKVKGII